MILSRVLVGFGINSLFALLAFGAGSVTLSGALGGVFIGTWIYGFLGPRGFSILAFFFIFASLFTRWGYRVKAARGIAQTRGGRRTEREAFANGAIGAGLATLAFFTGSLLCQVAFVAAFATAFADTTATEIGSLYGKSVFLTPSFKKVSAGTPGAVSFVGTLSGIFAAACLTYFAFFLALVQKRDIVFVIGGSSIGFLAESFLARTPLGHHDLRNFLNTFFGALATVILERLFYARG